MEILEFFKVGSELKIAKNQEKWAKTTSSKCFYEAKLCQKISGNRTKHVLYALYAINLKAQRKYEVNYCQNTGLWQFLEPCFNGLLTILWCTILYIDVYSVGSSWCNSCTTLLAICKFPVLLQKIWSASTAGAHTGRGGAAQTPLQQQPAIHCVWKL